MSNVFSFPTAARQEGARTAKDIEALTSTDFAIVIEADADDGLLSIEPEAEARLAAYLEFHGLRLPAHADATAIRQVCVELRFDYGQAIRLAAKERGAEIPVICPELNEDQVAYARAVGSQQLERARVLARRVFTGVERVTFLWL